MKWFRKIAKYLLVLFGIVVVVDVIVVIFFAVYQPKVKKADAIIVLGAAINSEAAYNRSLEGLRLYEQGMAPVIILSGGEDYSGAMSEAEYMEKIIESQSQSPVPLIIEDKSHSTYDNIINAKKELGGHAGSVIIVSDSYHLARAYFVASREGFGPIYLSSPPPRTIGLVDTLYYYGREVLAMLDYIPKFIWG